MREYLSNRLDKRTGNTTGVLPLLMLLVLFLVGSTLWSAEGIVEGDVKINGLTLTVTPQEHSVPANTPTAIKTTLSIQTPRVLKGLTVKGELRGPGLNKPMTLTTLPNHSFSIPAFSVKGKYYLENIRLERDGAMLLQAAPDNAIINVMDIVVNRIETRPLTLEEIKERGINITEDNFTVFNFTVALVVESQEVEYEFPVVYSQQGPYIPTIRGAGGAGGNGGGGFGLGGKRIPFVFDTETNETPTQIGGGSAVENTSQSPKMMGVLVFSNDFAFLNQFFSVMFIVGNNAPDGSPIVLKDVTAQLTLPPGLREASTTPPHIAGTPIPVRCPGPDGKIGTADDLNIIMATFNGMAEFLAEGLKEGNHVIDVSFQGTLAGLPTGEIPVKGSASGALLVRNPNFSITFSHPEVIRYGEKYDIIVTLQNTSPVPANALTISLPEKNLLGCQLLGRVLPGEDPLDEAKLSQTLPHFDTIAPGQVETIHYRMLSKETGKVRATAVSTEGNIQGTIELVAGVGENGIVLSPDTIVLPSYAYALPHDIIRPVMISLGEAYSLATAPQGNLPEDLPLVSRETVEQRIIDLTEAGQRVEYGDDLTKSLQVLALDWLGNRSSDLPFDILHRTTSKGFKITEAFSVSFNTVLTGQTPIDFQKSFAETCSYKNPFMAAQLSFNDSERHAGLVVTDIYKNRLTATEPGLTREIPFGEIFPLLNSNGSPVDFSLFAVADELGYTIDVLGQNSGSFDLSLIVPDAAGGLNQVLFNGIACAQGSRATITVKPGDTTFTLSIDADGDGAEDTQQAGQVTAIQQPPLQLLGAVQDCRVDGAGRVTALVFNKTISSLTAKEKTNYTINGKDISGCFLQPSGRVILVGAERALSPFVENRVQVENLQDVSGNTMAPADISITTTITAKGGVVYGNVMNAGSPPTPITNAAVYLLEIENDGRITRSRVTTDADGAYCFDFVRLHNNPFTLEVYYDGKRETAVARLMNHEQRYKLDVVIKSRGSIAGKVTDSVGTPLKAFVFAAPENGALGEIYQTQCNEQGEYLLKNLPMGNIHLRAHYINHGGATSTTLETPEETKKIDMTLYGLQYGAVEGHVLMSDGVTAVTDTNILVYRDGRPINVWLKSDEKGYFKFPEVAVGRVKVYAQNPQTGQYVPAEADVIEGETANVAIVFKGTGTIKGTIWNSDNTPAANIPVGILGTYFFQDTGLDGTFVLKEVPLGNYNITAKYNGQLVSVSARLNREDDGSNPLLVRLDLPAPVLPGGLKGIVRDPGGLPVAGADVIILEAGKPTGAHVLTGQDGSYEVNNLTPGSYTTVVQWGDDMAGSKDGAVLPGKSTTGVDVNLKGKGTVKINVYDSTGNTRVMVDLRVTITDFVNTPEKVGFTRREEYYSSVDTEKIVASYAGDYSVKASNEFYREGKYSGGPIDTGQTIAVNIDMPPLPKLKVTVNGPDNNPLPGAALTLKCGALELTGGPTSDGTDGEEPGTYTFPIVPSGNFYMTAMHTDTNTGNNFVGAFYGNVPAIDGTHPVSMKLLGQGNVTVTVKRKLGDGSEEVISNANIELKNIGYPHTVFTKSANTVADSFTFDKVHEGPFSVAVFHADSNLGGRVTGELTGAGTTQDVVVYLDPSAAIQGAVLDPVGNPLETPTQVVLKSNADGLPYASFTTGTDGLFQFLYIPAGDYTLTATDTQAWSTGQAGVSITAEDDNKTITQDVYLEGWCIVEGHFYYELPANGEHATIILRKSGVPDQSLTVDDEGYFRFSKAPLGTFSIIAMDPKTGYGTIEEVTGERHLQEILLSLQKQETCTVSGTVTDSDNQAAASASVTLLTSSGSNLNTDADINGVYSIPNVPYSTNPVTVTASESNGSDSGSVTFNLQPGDNSNIDVAFRGLGSVQGVVTDEEGQGIGGITVQLKASGSHSDSTTTSLTEPVGSYSFPNVWLEDFTVTVTAAGDRGASASGKLETKDQVVTLDFQLAAVGNVSGYVFNPGETNEPAVGAYVELKAGPYTRNTITDENGWFQFATVQKKDLQINVTGLNGAGLAKQTAVWETGAPEVSFPNVKLDNTPPQVTATTPPFNSQGLAASLNSIQLVFSEAMNETTIAQTQLWARGSDIANSTATIVSYTVTKVDDQTYTLTFSPPPLSGATYTVSVPTTVKDWSGNSMAGEASWILKTADTQPPHVVSVTPGNGSQKVAVSPAVEVVFNEPLDGSKLTQDNVYLVKTLPAGDPSQVYGTVTLRDGQAHILDFVLPTGTQLETNATYQLTVQGAVDGSGLVQAAPYTSTFSTIDTEVPTLATLVAAVGNSVMEGDQFTVTATTANSDVQEVYFVCDGITKTVVTPSLGTTSFNTSLTAPKISGGVTSFTVIAYAKDDTGNIGPSTALQMNLDPDVPPTVTLTGGPSDGFASPGDSYIFNVDADDQVQLQSVTFSAEPVVESTAIAPTAVPTGITVNIPGDIPVDSIINVVATATDSYGYSTSAEQTIIIKPARITLTSPTEGQRFKYDTDPTNTDPDKNIIKLAASVRNDITPTEVRFYKDGQLLENGTLTSPPYEYDFTVPQINQETQVLFTAQMTVDGNHYDDQVTVVVEQWEDPNAPKVRLLGPTTGSLVYPGEDLSIQLKTLSNYSVDRVEFSIGEGANTLVSETVTIGRIVTPEELLKNSAGALVIPQGTAPNTTLWVKAIAVKKDETNPEIEYSTTLHSEVTVVTGDVVPAGTTINADNFDWDNKVIIINDGTVTINGSHSFTHVLVKGNGILTHGGATNATIEKLDIMVTGGEIVPGVTLPGQIVVGPDARIDTNGKGYLGGYSGNNISTNAMTEGFMQGSITYAGGSYGGYGVRYGGNAANAPYGSIYTPEDAGSGGGSGGAGSYKGGNGGGIIRLSTQTFIVDGVVNSNGTTATLNYGGSGSGGSIYIDTEAINGTGQIKAAGGEASNTSNRTGGGGRIALYYTTNNGFDLDNNISANGGQYEPAPANGDYNGAAGTVYLKKAGLPGEIKIDSKEIDSNYETGLSSSEAGTITALTATVLTDANADFVANSLVDMTLQPNLNDPATFKIIANTATTIEIEAGGDLTAVAAVGDTYNVYGNNDLSIGANTRLRITGSKSFADLTLDEATLTLDGQLEVEGNLALTNSSTITHSSWAESAGNGIHIKAGNLSIDSTSSITADGLGFLGAYSVGNESGATGQTDGYIAANGSGQYSGGSYGGFGGQYGGQHVNHLYGSIKTPQTPGAGGGGLSSAPGTNGGGVIRVEVTGKLTVEGVISTNGLNKDGNGGAGAGGSIWIDADTLEGSGSIRANGGNASLHGAGGGGRIAIYYNTTTTFNLETQAYSRGGTLTSTSPTDEAKKKSGGSAGSLYLNLKTDGQEGQLIVENNNQESNTPVIFRALPPATTLSRIAANELKNDSLSFIPGSLVGMDLLVTVNNQEKSFTITANTDKIITTDAADGDLPEGDNIYKSKRFFDGHLVIRNTKAQLMGHVEVTDLTVKSGAELSHPAANGATVYDMIITVPGTLTVDSGSSLNADGKGYLGAFQPGNDTDSGLTYSNLTASGRYCGGSHGGSGGKYSTNNVGPTFDSLYEPSCAGSGGGGESGDFVGTSGGGIIRINGGAILNNGSISASGLNKDGGWGGTGAGGSIYIRVNDLTNNGIIRANGGDGIVKDGQGNLTAGSSGVGGGGRIAIYCNDISNINSTNTQAFGGKSGNGSLDGLNGGAGTVYLKDTTDTEHDGGELIIDNNNTTTTGESTKLPAVTAETPISTSIDDYSLTDANKPFSIDSLKGIKLNPNTTQNNVFTIISNTDTQIFTDPAGNAMTGITVGGNYQGEHHLYKLVIKGKARVSTEDRVIITGPAFSAPETDSLLNATVVNQN